MAAGGQESLDRLFYNLQYLYRAGYYYFTLYRAK
jgi:hypothetical protein